MKRCIALFLILVIALSLCACRASNVSGATDDAAHRGHHDRHPDDKNPEDKNPQNTQTPTQTECVHQYEGAFLAEPTCTGNGLYFGTCSLCQDTKTEEWPPWGHEFVGRTCTDPGVCTRCGTTVDGTFVPQEHRFEEATCEKPKTCELCGYAEGKPLEHVYSDADCVNPRHCGTCSLTEGEPLGHDDGRTGVCNRCGMRGPNFRELSPSVWECMIVKDQKLFRFTMKVDSSGDWRRTVQVTVCYGSNIQTLDEQTRNDLLATPEKLTEYQEEQYYLDTCKNYAPAIYEEPAEEVAILLDIDQGKGDVYFMLERIAGDKFIISDISHLGGWFQDSEIKDAFMLGSVFTWISY